MAQRNSNTKVANRLVSASCAAVLAVYVAGYSRTQSAANRIAAQTAERRSIAAVPVSPLATSSFEELRLSPGPLVAAKPPRPKPDKVVDESPSPAEAVPAEVPPAPPDPMWKDGTYTGWGYSRHGNIEAEVVIDGGRIASAVISQCRTRYSCSVIDKLPPEVAERQGPEVDFVSGATQSADAFYGAVVAALSKAK
jgi:uncharacterized protein with FMN-binding domain